MSCETMLNYEALDSLPATLPGPVHLAVGMFDGVHLGHREVIGGAVRAARQAGGTAGVLTFWPHPSHLFRPAAPERQILDRGEKAARLAELGPDFVVCQPFTPGFAELDAAGFLAALRKSIPRLAAIHVGKNFRFGRGRSGDVDWLVGQARAGGLHVFSANNIEADGERISSTRIRGLITAGEIARAGALLGYNYRALGGVVSGRALGRRLGFPTLNIPWAPDLLPRFGVYAVRMRRVGAVGQWWPGVANYGLRPTVEASPTTPLLEVHVLADGETVDRAGLVDGALEVEWLEFIRPEEKFSDVGALRARIEKDTATARAFFAR